MGLLDIFRPRAFQAPLPLAEPPKAEPPLTRTAAPVLPWTINPLAPQEYSWEDLVYDLAWEEGARLNWAWRGRGYATIRLATPVGIAIRKLGGMIASRNLSMECEYEAFADVVTRRVLNRITGLGDAITWLTWSVVEGACFVWMQAGLTQDGWLVPALAGGGRRRWQCGGNIAFDGMRTVKVEEFVATPFQAEAMSVIEYPRDRFMIWRPGGGGNPNGDLDLARRIYVIARDYLEARKGQAEYSERHAVPLRVFKGALENATPQVAAQILSEGARRLADATRGQALGLDARDMAQLVEPTGSSSQFMREYTSALADDVLLEILGATLPTKTTGSGPAGSSAVQERSQDEIVEGYIRSLEEQALCDLGAFITRVNAVQLEAVARSLGLARVPEFRLRLTQPFVEKDADLYPVIASFNAGMPVVSRAYFNALGTDVPKGVPEVIVKPRDGDPLPQWYRALLYGDASAEAATAAAGE